MKRGIDVSEHNGVINWSDVKASGIDFAMLRAGYGKGKVDKQFNYNAAECNRIGLPIGVYWFSYAKTADEARDEAIWCAETIAKYKIDYPVAFDWEDDSLANCKKAGVSVIGKGLPTAFAINFLNTIQSRGYKPILYTNPAYINQFFDLSRISHPLWLAKWPITPVLEKRPDENPEIWQYSAKGQVAGVNTAVDMNVCYVDYVPEVKEEKDFYKILMEKLNFEKQKTWLEKDIALAKEMKISDGSRPYEICSRAEAMAMAARAASFAIGYVDGKINAMMEKLTNDGK